MCDRIRHCSDGRDERGCSCKLSNLIPLCWYRVLAVCVPCMCTSLFLHAASHPDSFQLTIAIIVTTADTSTSRPSSRGSNLGIILGTTFGVISVLSFVCGVMIALVKSFIRSQSHSSNVPPRVQQPCTTYSYSLQQPSTVNSTSEVSSTSTGVPYSTVPLESELQNAPPPAYSTSHQYPAYTQPDEATSQNKSTPHGEEHTAEAPPSYGEEHIQELPPPYPD